MSDDARDRASGPPLLPNVLLALAFVALVVIGVVTVLVPELSGDSEDEDGAAAETTSGEAAEESDTEATTSPE